MSARHFWDGKDSRGREVRAYAARGWNEEAPAWVSFRVKVPTRYGLEPKGGDTRRYEEAWAKEAGRAPPAEWHWKQTATHKIRDVLRAASLPAALAIGKNVSVDARAVVEVAVAWDQWLERAAQ